MAQKPPNAFAHQGPVHFDPMNAQDRRIIHMALVDEQGVRSESEAMADAAREDCSWFEIAHSLQLPAIKSIRDQMNVCARLRLQDDRCPRYAARLRRYRRNPA
jgi:hypothetical protein